ncbi:MAG: hypothetical protein ACYDHN_16970, partial [Solirubrobacteraceae bacterium]
DILVASVAIFLAAIAAAIYAKPSYDAARALVEPPVFAPPDVTVRSGGSECHRVHDVNGHDTFLVGTPLPTSVEIEIAVLLKGTVPRQTLTNFLIASPCRLTPISNKPGHEALGNEPLYELLPNQAIRVSGTVARREIFPSVRTFFAVRATLHDAPSPWPDQGWPIRVMVRGNNQPLPSLDHTWWIAEGTSAAGSLGEI